MSATTDKLKAECNKAIEHFKKDILKLRTGRATTSLLENLTADYYGSQTPLIQLGLINAPEPRMLTVQVYDANAVEAVEKAIQQSELGLNPSRDGNLVRVIIPALTEDRRKDLVKKLHKMAEDSKVGLRNHRRDSNDELKIQERDKKISADDHRRQTEEVQKIIDNVTVQVDQLVTAKEKEIMEV